MEENRRKPEWTEGKLRLQRDPTITLANSMGKTGASPRSCHQLDQDGRAFIFLHRQSLNIGCLGSLGEEALPEVLTDEGSLLTTHPSAEAEGAWVVPHPGATVLLDTYPGGLG